MAFLVKIWPTYIGEEDARNTTTGMETLGVALGGVVTARETPPVAGDGVLVSLDAAIIRVAIVSQGSAIILQEVGELHCLSIPADGQIRSGNNLDKVHKVEVGVLGLLRGAVQRVQVVVGPGQGRLLAQSGGDFIGQLRTKAQRMDGVGEVVRLALRNIPVVLQVVNVHVAIAEASARGKMEVAHHLVHAQVSLDATALLALGIELLGVVLALALLDILTSAKGPRGQGVCFSDFVAGIAAAGLLGVGGRLGAVTIAAVVGSEVFGGVVVEVEGFGVDDAAAAGLGLESDLVDSVHDAVLLLARDIHDIEGQELAGHLGKGDIEVDLHSLTCTKEKSVSNNNLGGARYRQSGGVSMYLFPCRQSTPGVSRPGASLPILPRPGTGRQ